MEASPTRQSLQFLGLVLALLLPLWTLGFLLPDSEGLPKDIPVTDFGATFVPVTAAAILVYRREGRAGIARLLARAFDYRRIKDKRWYFVAFLSTPLLYGLILGAQASLSDIHVQIDFPLHTIGLLFVMFFVMAAGEELGYVRYVDLLQQRFGALRASILIGVPWHLLHIPSILQQGKSVGYITFTLLFTVSLRVLYVWLYNNSGRSAFAVIVMHAAGNLTFTFLPQENGTLVLAALAAVVAFLWGPATLARFRFSTARTSSGVPCTPS